MTMTAPTDAELEFEVICKALHKYGKPVTPAGPGTVRSLCPNHGIKQIALLVRRDDDHVAVRCYMHNGCTREQVLTAIGIKASTNSQAPPQQDAPASEERRSWRPVDLTDVLDGKWKPPEPTVGRRTDDKGLFYVGKCHTVISETEGGKTWFALSAALDEMQAGNHVLYIDFEDDEGGIVGRLLTLGCKRERIRNQFHYIRPESPLDQQGGDDILDIVTTYRPTLDIIDGVTEAMTMHNLNPLDNKDAAAFGRRLPRPIASYGAAVVNLDHVTKDREGRGRYAIGAVHKLNALNGAAYILENRQSFGVGITGRSTLKISKDRPGQLRRNALTSSGGLHWYGDLVLASEGEDFAEVAIYPPQERDENFRPTVYMARIAEALTKHGPFPSKNALETAITGRAQVIRDALAYLIQDGYVTGKAPYTLLKPYAS